MRQEVTVHDVDRPEQPGDRPSWEPPLGSEYGTTPGYEPPTGGHQTGQKTPGNAVAALVLGILGLVLCPIICSVLAIIFGQQARQEIERDPSLTGGGLATAGFVMGIVGLALYGGLLLLWALVLGASA
jgi:hypothetical protein